MSLIILYKLYKSKNNREENRITKNINCLVKSKYLKKISF